jgi:GT2 family glycosyltransferase
MAKNRRKTPPKSTPKDLSFTPTPPLTGERKKEKQNQNFQRPLGERVRGALKKPGKAPARPLPPKIPKPAPFPEAPVRLAAPFLSESPHSLLRELERKFEKALSRPKVSVVLASHDNVDALWHCLFALKTQSYPPHEIILVDNASEDASVPFVRANYPQVEILECQENFGPAMGLNLGIKMATGHLVALVDPETVVTPDGLGRMVKDFQKTWPRFGLLAAPVGREPGRKAPCQTLNILGNPVEGYLPDPLELFGPGRGAVLFPRFLAPEGPFDGDYFWCREQAYLGWRFRFLGHAVGKSPEAKVFQKADDSTPEIPEWKTTYYETRNRWLNLLLFYGDRDLFKILPWVLAEGLFRLARSLGVGFSSFWGILCAIGWIGLHPRLIYKKRQAVQEKRKAPDPDLLKRLSGRVARDGGILSRALNLFSLAYCRLVGLEVLESQE